jgi:AcrR family transcriptional regulator
VSASSSECPAGERLYEAAMEEYTRVGLEQARVEDIVAAAGVSWGTFFHYFPAKEDVLLDASARISLAYSAAVVAGLEAGAGTEDVLADAFTEMNEAAEAVTSSAVLRGKVLMYVISNPGNLTAFIGERDDGVPPPVPATTAVIAEGQRRGEIRADEPAESPAVIVLYSVLFSARRAANLGRPPGSTPLGRLALQIVLRGMRPLEAADRRDLPVGRVPLRPRGLWRHNPLGPRECVCHGPPLVDARAPRTPLAAAPPQPTRAAF